MAEPATIGARAQEELLAEAQDLAEEAERHVAALEGADLRRGVAGEHLGGLFRAVHTLKGVSGLFGLEAIASFAHALEDLLDALRFERASLDPTTYALLDDAVAALAQRIASLRAGDAPDEATFDAVLARLRRVVAASPTPPRAPPGEGLPERLRGLTAHEEHRLRARLDASDRVVTVRVRCPLARFDESLATARADVAAHGEVIACLPTGELDGDGMEVDLLLASELSLDALRSALDARGLAATALDLAGGGDAAVDLALARPAGEAGRVLPSVRMEVRRLDELLAGVGELALLRHQLAGMAERARGASVVGAGELARVQRALGRTVERLQRSLLDARMVPMGQVFERLGREARKRARQLGKDVRLVVTGAATSLDKLQVDELGPPLLHLLRNAIDHGIEAPAARLAAGKPAEGTVSINAWQSGSFVVVEVEDDGAGVDLDDVRRAALARGHAGAASMDPRALFALLFRPGFSTRDAVTGTSGRGVGLDVVRSSIAKLGGVVDLRSETGRSTRVTITLPITLAIVACLLVEVAGRRYAIPLAAVAEVARVPASPPRVDGRAALSRDGRTIPLFGLGRWLGHSSADAGGVAVLLAFAGRIVALRVDRIAARRDVVIKPLGQGLRDLRGFAGAAELGDEGVTLVLDPAALIDDLLASEREAAGDASR